MTWHIIHPLSAFLLHCGQLVLSTTRQDWQQDEFYIASEALLGIVQYGKYALFQKKLQELPKPNSELMNQVILSIILAPLAIADVEDMDHFGNSDNW